MKVSIWTSELHGGKIIIGGFGRNRNYFTEDTVVGLDGAHEEGCV